MPKSSKLNLPPLNLGKETLGQRLARLRKERGHTQIELAKNIGITQALVSDYERDRLRPHYEMIIRFALSLEVTTDELLGVKKTKGRFNVHLAKLWRKLKVVETFSEKDRKAVLQYVDVIAEKNKAQQKAASKAT